MLAVEAALAATGFILQALFLGALITAGFLLPRGEPLSLRHDLVRIALSLLFFFLLAGLLFLFLQGAKLEGGKFPSLSTLERYISRTQSGSVWLTREAYGALLLLGTLRLLRQGSGSGSIAVLVFFSLPLLASRSLMSHAIAVKDGAGFIVAADAIHLIATALWAGTLPSLFFVLLRSPKPSDQPLALGAYAVRRFSWLAFFSISVLGLTGFYQSWVHVQQLNLLFNTAYGRALLAKLAIVFVMLVLGAWNFFSTRPALAKAATLQPALAAALRRIGAESIFGVLVLCVTGFLSVLPPAVHGLHEDAHAASGSHSNHAMKKLAPAEGAGLRILSRKTVKCLKEIKSLLALDWSKESARSTSMLMSTARSWACSRETKEPLRESRRVNIGWS